MSKRFDYIIEIEKYNPYHDSRGRFASASGVEGKDISSTFRYDPSKGTKAVEQVIKAQGFDGKPELKDIIPFFESAMAAGTISYRGLSDDNGRTAAEFKEDLKSGPFYIDGKEPLIGYGMYAATARYTDSKARVAALREAESYGLTICTMTVRKNFKTVDGETIKKEFSKVKHPEFFDNDIGAYAAAKGYDAITLDINPGEYTNIFNRTKLIILDD